MTATSSPTPPSAWKRRTATSNFVAGASATGAKASPSFATDVKSFATVPEASTNDIRCTITCTAKSTSRPNSMSTLAFKPTRVAFRWTKNSRKCLPMKSRPSSRKFVRCRLERLTSDERSVPASWKATQKPTFEPLPPVYRCPSTPKPTSTKVVLSRQHAAETGFKTQTGYERKIRMLKASGTNVLRGPPQRTTPSSTTP